MFASQMNFFRSMADHETFALTQCVLHLLKTDFDLQHMTAVRYRKPKYGVVETGRSPVAGVSGPSVLMLPT